MTRMNRRSLLTATAATLPLLGAGTDTAAPSTGPTPAGGLPGPAAPAGLPRVPHGGKGRDKTTRILRRWAEDTWSSIDAMAEESTGLVSDNIDDQLTTPARYTSPTNIGGYLWSTLIARDLGFLTFGHARRRISRTLDSLEQMERHEPSGMYVNWYDPHDGSIVRSWPEDGEPVTPFVSSVDMGWLGAALHVVAQADPSNRKRAQALFEAMRWDIFFDPDFGDGPGATIGGFWLEDPGREDAGLLPPFAGIDGPDLWYHVGHHYDTAISEARMVTYLGMIRDQIPAAAYFGTYRTFPPDWDWAEMIPVGQWRTYEGVDVFEGAHEYRGMRVVPGWGGSMFEELMPDLFVPEAEWAPQAWGVNHPLHVRAQREHGMKEAGYGYWGFSPCSNPAGGYREYGVDALGLNPDGYFSDQEETDYRTDDPPTEYGDGVVTPHAAFLGMQYEPEEGFENLSRLESELGCYGPGGFLDAVATDSGQLARRHLSLDQSMIMGALGNILLGGRLREWFATDDVETVLRPVIEQEVFGAGS